MWQDLNDAQMRARHTVVRFNTKPVYITSILIGDNRTLVAEFMYLSNGLRSSAPLTDEKWDWSPVPTGFVNVADKVYYVQRRPCRKYKHGLAKDNCTVYPSKMQMMDIFKSKQFGKTVMREYPSYNEALELMRSPMQVAFHPDFALSRGKVGPVYLLYRCDTVGWFERGELVLGNEWKFLKELVAEVIHVNA